MSQACTAVAPARQRGSVREPGLRLLGDPSVVVWSCAYHTNGRDKLIMAISSQMRESLALGEATVCDWAGVGRVQSVGHQTRFRHYQAKACNPGLEALAAADIVTPRAPMPHLLANSQAPNLHFCPTRNKETKPPKQDPLRVASTARQRLSQVRDFPRVDDKLVYPPSADAEGHLRHGLLDACFLTGKEDKYEDLQATTARLRLQHVAGKVECIKSVSAMSFPQPPNLFVTSRCRI